MSRRFPTRVLGAMAALASAGAVGGISISACSFSATNQGTEPPADAELLFDSPPDVFIPDAAPCGDTLPKVCVTGDVLRACVTQNQLPVDTVCDWGCVDPGGNNGRCQRATPSGGAVSMNDIDPTMAMGAGLQGKTISTSAVVNFTITINTDDGSIVNNSIGQTIRQAGTGVRNGIEFERRSNNSVGVFRFDSLTIEGGGTVRVRGSAALALVSIKTLTIKDNVTLDLKGECSGNSAGPGGSTGGNGNSNGNGNGAGGAGDATGVCTGGGGAGFGRQGANGGGRNNNAGQTYGNGMITTLLGGAGGGGGGTGGTGGGGGGALQLVANQAITFNGNIFGVVINAGGCGGSGGPCGGGGGAGGAVLVEGRTVDFGNAAIVVNGGGGGGAASGADGGDGGTMRASGGAGAQPAGANNDGGDGGDGGAGNQAAEGGGVRDMRGGGGGGGVGWIRINTKTGSVGGNIQTSPQIGQPSASQGTVNVQ